MASTGKMQGANKNNLARECDETDRRIRARQSDNLNSRPQLSTRRVQCPRIESKEFLFAKKINRVASVSFQLIPSS